MLVIGIDPGTAILGYGLARQNGLRLEAIEYGVLTTPAGLAMELRLKQLYEELTRVLARHRPVAGAVEQLYFGKNVRSALTVAQARGVALLALANAGLPVYEYTPLQVKQAILGRGRGEKFQMQNMVRMLLGLPDLPRPDDAADALAVAICHLNFARFGALSRLAAAP